MNKLFEPVRCGIDLMEIGRISRAYEKRPAAFMRRFFTLEEQTLLRERPHLAKHLAARVAGKEAVFKLLGGGLGAVSWTEVEIFTRPGGEPWVRLQGRAASKAREVGISCISLSLSHCREYAVAQAVALVSNT